MSDQVITTESTVVDDSRNWGVDILPNSILWTTARRWTTPYVVKKVTFGGSFTLSMAGDELEKTFIHEALTHKSFLESVANEKANEKDLNQQRLRLIGRGQNTDDYDITYVYLSDALTRKNTFANNERMWKDSIDNMGLFPDSSDEDPPQEPDKELAEIINTDCVIG